MSEKCLVQGFFVFLHIFCRKRCLETACNFSRRGLPTLLAYSDSGDTNRTTRHSGQVEQVRKDSVQLNKLMRGINGVRCGPRARTEPRKSPVSYFQRRARRLTSNS